MTVATFEETLQNVRETRAALEGKVPQSDAWYAAHAAYRTALRLHSAQVESEYGETLNHAQTDMFQPMIRHNGRAIGNPRPLTAHEAESRARRMPQVVWFNERTREAVYG